MKQKLTYLLCMAGAAILVCAGVFIYRWQLEGEQVQSRDGGTEGESASSEAADGRTEDEDHGTGSRSGLSDPEEAAKFIDYEFIQENHEILDDNIYASPRYDYADTILEGYLREDVEAAERLREIGVLDPITIDYVTYDLNADGLEDYLVCKSGIYCTGSGGNEFEIYVQEEEGTLRKVYSVTTRIHDVSGLPGGHAPIAVLNEKTDEYYVLVMSPNSSIMRYDADSGAYHSVLPLSELGKAADFIDYEYLAHTHWGSIQKYNICASPRYDYADTILEGYLQQEVEEAGQVAEGSEPAVIEYFRYDFNDDGLEDYLVCMSGALWTKENDGNEVRIYVQDEGETVRMVFSGTVPLHLPDVSGLRGGHAPIAVLGMGSNDHHWLVLPGNRRLVYDADSGRYHYDAEEDGEWENNKSDNVVAKSDFM